MNKILKPLHLSILVSVLAMSAHNAFAAKMTVGQLLQKLKNEDRGGKIKSMEKGDTELPESQFSFKNQQSQVNLQAVKPPRSTEVLKFEPGNDQADYEKTLDKQIQELYKLTKKFETSSNRGELWLRLAELYVEKSALVDFRKQDLYDQQLRDFQDGRTKVKPKLDTIESKQYNQKAIQLYEWFLRDYPNDEKVSQALFFLGYNHFELGHSDVGSKYYDQLTKKFPRSPYVGEAHFALGEYYFEKEKWADAYKEYSTLIKDKRHRLHAFSLYKGGWCLYRLGKTEEAIRYLDFIIKMGSDPNAGSLTKKNIGKSKLENEALRDIVVFFADISDTKRAVEYFRSLTGTEQNIHIEKLAYYYADKGMKDSSRDVFQMLIKSDPTSKKAFEYQYQIVKNYFFSKNSPQFKEALYRWINDYKRDSEWYNKNKSDTAFIENSNKLREQTLRNYIMQQHQTAQNSRASYSRQTALEGYQLYFQEFSEASQAADMHFFYAELLYDMNKFDEAATQYAWVAENSPNNKYAAKAGQNILLSIEKALPKDEEIRKTVGDSTTPIAFDPRVERFLKSAKWYLDKFPKSEKNAEIKFRMARLYYQTNHFDEAEALFREITQQHSNTKFSNYSANLLLDIYNIKKDYIGLEKVGNELLQNSAIASSQAGSDIRGVLERASFKKAQDLEVDKKYTESAEQFQSFAKQNAKSDLVSMALFNAGVNFERAGKNNEAIQSYKQSLKAKDKNSETIRPKSEKLLAKLYQDSGQFEESAQLFKKIAHDNPKDPLMPNYLFNSAVMYEALGKNKEAINAYNEFLDHSKRTKDSADTIFNLAELMRKSNSLSAAVEKYKEYTEIAADGIQKVEAYYWLYDLGHRLNKNSLFVESKSKAINSYNKLKSGDRSKAAKFIAKMKYDDALVLYSEMRSVTIPADPAKQKKAVDKKLDLVSKTTELLTETIKLDSSEEIVSSLNLLGETNEHISNAIENTPLPAGLKEEQKKIYIDGIKKIIEPFNKKAIESYKAAVDRGQDLQVYSDAYKHALRKMNEVDSKTYYYGPELYTDTRLIQWMGDK